MLIVCEKPCVVEGWMDGRMDGWMDGWMGGKARLRIAYSNQKWHSLYTNNLNKPKMIRFLKFKFLIALNLNFNGGQFYE